MKADKVTSRRTLFVVLAIAGAIVPWLFFARFFAVEGFGGSFVGALFVNGAAGGFASDVLISSAVFWIFLFREARLRGIRHAWAFVVINLAVGLSCALPLFLWARERSVGPSTTT